MFPSSTITLLAPRSFNNCVRASLRLVALTGYGGPEQRERALAAGFDRHVVKPVEPEQLLQIIAEELAG